MSLLLRMKKRTRVSDAAEGDVVVLEGKVAEGKAMTVPGTSVKCVAYWLLTEAWQHGARGRGRKMWVPSNQAMRTEGFYLDDGTGTIWVGGTEEALELIGGREEAGPMGKKGKARYFCRTIARGDTVRVQGTLDRPRGSEPGDSLVVRPGPKGILRVMLRKKG